MAFLAYKNKNGEVFYCFPGDENRIPGYNQNTFTKMPPNPIVVHSTMMIMTDIPTLDCIETAHELNELLTMEAAYERETKKYNEFRKRER